LGTLGKASVSKLRIYAKKDGRYDVSWYDQVGKRHVSTRKTLAAAKSFQAQKIAQLERRREGRFYHVRGGIGNRARPAIRRKNPSGAKWATLAPAESSFQIFVKRLSLQSVVGRDAEGTTLVVQPWRRREEAENQ
jgi:hypothetical protein